MKANLPDSIIIWEINIKIIVEHHGILISSELRSLNLIVEGAPESKNLDIYNFNPNSLFGLRALQRQTGTLAMLSLCPWLGRFVPGLGALIANHGRFIFPAARGCGGLSSGCGEVTSARVALSHHTLQPCWPWASQLGSALPQHQGLWAADQRAGRRRGQGKRLLTNRQMLEAQMK